MKLLGVVLKRLAPVLFALALSGCAHDPNKPNPCVGPASARPNMPCWCPGSTDPSCYPFPTDARKPHKEPTK